MPAVAREELPSLASLARARGLDPNIVYNRIYHGMSEEEALAKPCIPRRRPPTPRRKGILRAAREAGLSLATVKSRLARGKSFEEALTPVSPSRQTNVSAVARAHGILVSTLHTRLRRTGGDLEAALRMQPRGARK